MRFLVLDIIQAPTLRVCWQLYGKCQNVVAILLLLIRLRNVGWNGFRTLRLLWKWWQMAVVQLAVIISSLKLAVITLYCLVCWNTCPNGIKRYLPKANQAFLTVTLFTWDSSEWAGCSGWDDHFIFCTHQYGNSDGKKGQSHFGKFLPWRWFCFIYWINLKHLLLSWYLKQHDMCRIS